LLVVTLIIKNMYIYTTKLTIVERNKYFFRKPRLSHVSKPLKETNYGGINQLIRQIHL